MAYRGNRTIFPHPLRLLLITYLVIAFSMDAQASLRISEFLAINDSSITDEDGDSSDWIEIHNNSTSPVDIENWSLTDDVDLPRKWIFPSRMLQPNDRIIVFASNKIRTPLEANGELHTNFKLSGSGEYLALYPPVGSAATEFDPAYCAQFSDTSFGLGIPQSTSSTTEQAIYYPEPTPRAPENDGYLGFVEDTRFDVKRGFYDERFTETITCGTPGTTLVYTTDGSIPSLNNGTVVPPVNENSTPSLELQISKTTNLRVTATKPGWKSPDVDTQTYLFLNDVIQQDGSGIQPHAAWGGLDQSDWEMDPEIVNHPTWGPTLKDDLKSLPTVSLTMDWQELFGSTPPGIYIEGESDPRNCSVEYFVADGSEPGFHINASVQIQGGSSTGRWKVDKLSMRLKFKSEFDERDMVYPLYPDSPVDEFDTLILAAGHNLTWQHSSTNQSSRAGIVREQVVSDLQLQMSGNGATHHARFSHLYLNGIYWGLYALQERTDHNFAASYFGGNDDDYSVMKHDSTTLVNGDPTLYPGLLAQTRKNQSIDSTYQQTQEILDIDWLINYMILNHWAGSYDWAHHNWYTTFNHAEPNGKWRFHSWDAEHVMYDLNHMVMDENDTTHVFNSTRQRDDTGSPVEIHYNLMANPNYRLAFADGIQKYLNNDGILAPTNALQRFEYRVAEIDEAVNGEAARWGDGNEIANGSKFTKSSWLNEVEWLRSTYLTQRTNIVVQQYIDKGWFPNNGLASFAPFGGHLLEGDSVTIATDPNYTIYVTSDNSDPKGLNGSASATAVVHPSGNSIALNETTTLKARTKSPSGAWGPLTEAVYRVGDIALANTSNLIVSEIHYNPSEPTLEETNNPSVLSNDDFEFVEFLNTLDNQVVDLSKAIFTDGITFEFPEPSLINPQERVIIVSNQAAFETRYTDLNPAPRILGEFSGKLSNGGEALVLSNTDNTTIQSIVYNDKDPWPENADGDGYSLVFDLRSNNSNDGSNWYSSSQLHGTPGYSDTNSFLDWAIALNLTGGTADDPDQDSLSNLSEYFFGTDPKVPTDLASISDTQIKIFSPENIQNLYLAIVYRKSLSTQSVKTVLEFSRDLEEWTEYPELIESVEILQNGKEEIVIRSPIPLGDSLEPQFIRIRIEL